MNGFPTPRNKKERKCRRRGEPATGVFRPDHQSIGLPSFVANRRFVHHNFSTIFSSALSLAVRSIPISIIPARFLSSCDLSHLGNNVGGVPRDVVRAVRRRRARRWIAAVNRSLALHGERVAELSMPVSVAR